MVGISLSHLILFQIVSGAARHVFCPKQTHVSRLVLTFLKLFTKDLILTPRSPTVTTPHKLQRSHVDAKLGPLIKAGSPLAEWTNAFVQKTYSKIESLTRKQADPGLELHDPLCVWYVLTRSAPSWMVAPKAPEDIRVETAGQWTRGMHIVDRRNRKKAGLGAPEQVKSPGAIDVGTLSDSLSTSPLFLVASSFRKSTVLANGLVVS